MENQIKVGIADYKITTDPNSLITLGLGSCVGIAIYDRNRRIGGLSHIMLPDSTAFKSGVKPEKFADLAIPLMIKEMNGGTLKTRNLVAKIAGGASMFNFPDKKMTSEIGKRNVESVEKILSELDIPILGSHTGGNIGRTMIVDLSNFKVDIKTASKSIVVL
ncbi:chemotaxis protein CheD [Alkalibacter mobilis]|uniref:chemotaxis protein CheD n=1 Tax=Alkalibacter mobilis TaxID=2787712 RepID=UPI00189CCA8C|nr:chemotaxis protein CheD [Alkalibacter mobilis]MBF7096346.1 chemotaxis protein CheD [Alkalibacter mobilis]